MGCLEKDNLKLQVIGPKWQSCTTFGTSYGYLEGDTYKTVESVIHEMVEVISRNGNFLINIGPKADGTLVPEQVERLRAMGNWLKINGDAIYGTRYWKVKSAERTPRLYNQRQESLRHQTRKPTAPFTIVATAGWQAADVESVRLLGSESPVDWSIGPDGLRITPPSDTGKSQFAWSFEIVTKSHQHQPNAIVSDPDQALQPTRKVDLDGSAR